MRRIVSLFVVCLLFSLIPAAWATDNAATVRHTASKTRKSKRLKRQSKAKWGKGKKAKRRHTVRRLNS